MHEGTMWCTLRLMRIVRAQCGLAEGSTGGVLGGGLQEGKQNPKQVRSAMQGLDVTQASATGCPLPGGNGPRGGSTRGDVPRRVTSGGGMAEAVCRGGPG